MSEYHAIFNTLILDHMPIIPVEGEVISDGVSAAKAVERALENFAPDQTATWVRYFVEIRDEKGQTICGPADLVDGFHCVALDHYAEHLKAGPQDNESVRAAHNRAREMARLFAVTVTRNRSHTPTA